MTYNQELRFRQHRFLKHVGHLINFMMSLERGLTYSIGRARDIPEVQPILLEKGLTSTLNSQHPKGLAIDINFFEGEYYLFSDPSRKEKDFALVLPIGEHWESLDKDNKWGGFWKKFPDMFHFQQSF